MKSSRKQEQKPAQAKPAQEQPTLRCMRISILVSAAAIFYSGLNPARVTSAIGQYVSLLTSALSYDALTGQLTSRAFKNTGITGQTFTLLQVASAILIVGIVIALIGACMSYGNKLMRTKGYKFPLIGALIMAVGLGGIIFVWAQIAGAATEKIPSMFPLGIPVFCVLIVLILVTTIMAAAADRKDPAPLEEKMEMQEKYHLFLLFVPVLALCFVFCYLPLWGWRYAFFDYQAGDTLSWDNFVGFKWFTILFQNETTRNDIIRVMINTLAMSGLGILTSWVPMIFAVFLMQLPSKKFRRFVQNATTIPNFIGWVIVYAIALAMFSTDGFVNSFLNNVCGIPADTNYLMDASHMWIKMLLWGMWKGVGWSAIIYVSSITGIDPGLYEAAEVDGASRWQKMWNVTIPQLMPTFFVLLLMSIANILSNGMEQYLVFSNAVNSKSLEVLDLYVYNLGIGNGQIPMSTAIGMFKSIVSVVLLFGANAASKKLRGESII
jgi:putative aldouronate transport system permease protein